MNIYDDAKRADKPNLWILLLTELVIRLAENLADVGKSNIYRYFLQNDFRFLIVNCALKNYKCVNSQLIVAESLNLQYNQCVKVHFERTPVGGIVSNLSGLLDSINTRVADVASTVGKTPQTWNGSIFSMIKSLSENVVVPIAGIILTFVMCLELIQLLIDRNTGRTCQSGSSPEKSSDPRPDVWPESVAVQRYGPTRASAGPMPERLTRNHKEK